MALEANADIITYAPQDKSVTEETATLMVQKKVVSVPTLTMMQAVSARPTLSAALGMIIFKPSLFMAIFGAKKNGQGQQTCENAKDSVTMMYRAGVPILAGPDCHEEPYSVFEVKHGEFLHQELELLVEAGVSVQDA